MFGKWNKRILTLALVFTFIFSTIEVNAYDFDAPHPDINTPQSEESIEENRVLLWHTIRSWGFSEAATAGLMGNFYGECAYNFTRADDKINNDMRNFILGEHGIGLIMWTYWSIQERLFEICDEMGVQWTDANAQLVALKELLWASNWWSYGGNYSSLDDFMNTDDVILATDTVCWGFERPYAPWAHLDRRRAEAENVYDRFKGTEVDLSLAQNTDGQSGSEENIADGSFVLSEWDLDGMPSRGDLLEGSNNVRLPNYNDLGVSEANSVSLIKNNILLEQKFSFYDSIRVGVVFLGLLLITYSALILVAYLFDRTNNLLEISLISILTLGKLKYADGRDYGTSKGYADSTKIIKVSILSIAIGLFIVSGGVFVVISEFMYKLVGVL